MPKSCANHQDSPAATMCHQCHKPICSPCTIVMPTGSFCSPECGILNREVKARLQEPKPATGGLGNFIRIVVAIGLVVLAFAGVHEAAKRIPKLRKIDIIGAVLELGGHYEKGSRQ